jgi:hypothetical protein
LTLAVAQPSHRVAAVAAVADLAPSELVIGQISVKKKKKVEFAVANRNKPRPRPKTAKT